MKDLTRLLIVIQLLLFIPLAQAENWQAQFRAQLKNGGAIIEQTDGKILFSHRAKETFVPASTIKVLTVAAALKQLGPETRFLTEFYRHSDGGLFVKGYGDPGLTSEEFAAIAAQLSPLLKKVEYIALDDSYFSPALEIDGVGNSLNPYDARNGALVVNFNTVNVTKSKHGVTSAEKQTPLTPLASELGKRLKLGTHRIPLGPSRDRSLTYFAELLREFLLKEGVKVSSKIEFRGIPQGAKLLYQHFSSKALKTYARELLEYSANFSSNQIFLNLGANRFGAPATLEKAQRAMRLFIDQELKWSNYHVEEGSGLSRKTKVSPQDLLVLLRYFDPVKDLLPLEQELFLAKTGSLQGVNTLIGYATLPNSEEIRYVILVNENVPHKHKFLLASRMYSGITESLKRDPDANP